MPGGKTKCLMWATVLESISSRCSAYDVTSALLSPWPGKLCQKERGVFIYCGAGIAQWLERRNRDRKVPGSSPDRNGWIIFFSRVNFLCWLLFRYPFHPHEVTAIARKRSLPGHSAKSAGGKLQLNTRTPYLCGFKWNDTVNWCMVELCTQKMRRDGSSSTWHQSCNNQRAWILKIRGIKGYSHSFRITRDMSSVSLLEGRE